jgi:hypothetical protein
MLLVTYPVLSVLTVRAEPGSDGGSTRMGVRAARALTGLSFSVASGQCNPIRVQYDPHSRHHAIRTHI